MTQKFPPSHGLVGMFRILEIRGPFFRLACLDFDDKEIDNIYAGEIAEPSVEEGSLHMMELVLSGGLLKIEFCSPAYEEMEWDCPMCTAEEEEESLH